MNKQNNSKYKYTYFLEDINQLDWVNNDLFKITGPIPYNLNDAIVETTNWFKKKYES